jgi:hypothetical protein
VTPTLYNPQVLDTPFLPSVHGFAFPNRWEEKAATVRIGGRDIQIAMRGRCGGMAFAALDYYRLGVFTREVWGLEMPGKDSQLGRYVLRRQIESLAGGGGANMRRFVSWTIRPTGTPLGSARLMRKRELGRVLVSMVAGNPVPLGLIVAERLGGVGLNHQVVACGAQHHAEGLTIRIYDPNIPARDDVTLEVSWRGEEPAVELVAGKPKRKWRGLFVERYRPCVPPEYRGR